MTRRTLGSVASLVAMCFALSAAQAQQPPQQAISYRDGKLSYRTDDRGDRVPDFSYCGYRAGEADIPNAPVRVVVPPAKEFQTERIQAAIDYVAGLNPDENGIRGAVLLEKGRFEIGGTIHIRQSGVVLRGSGPQTILEATGKDRRPLIVIGGRDDRALALPIDIVDDYVPVNARRLRVAPGADLKVGDAVLVRRPSTAEWIKAMRMDDMGGDRHGFSWRAGSRDLVWDRTIAAVDGDIITLDAPLTCSIEKQLGGGTIRKYDWPGRISNVGVENLACVSVFDQENPKDEEHSWFGIVIDNTRDAWVRQVTFRHFAGGAVCAWENATRITVEHCKYLQPVSEIGGGRRRAFFTAGQLNLFAQCHSENATHDFSVGFCAAGPNAFVQCESMNSQDDSGPIESLAAGVLLDLVRIDGNALSFMDRQYRAQGAGWSAVNSVMWNCSAAVVRCFRPPTQQNWAFGCWGEFSGDGFWQNSNDYIEPTSLYVAQLVDRLGESARRRIDLMPVSTEASSSPSPETAASLVAASTKPAMTISDWIDSASTRRPIPTEPAGARHIDEIWTAPPAPAPPITRRLSIAQGKLMIDGKPATGSRAECPWWRGSTRPDDLPKAPPAVTRFVPGRIGQGATDDLAAMTAWMLDSSIVMFEQHPPLWYDRRRDDHQRVRRMDGDVAAPFLETPFARSGQGSAYDGLSLFDLTKPNEWYFSRLSEFAGWCELRGLILFNQHYFQHSILEAGAHYADFPWRSANNVNDPGLPEPPPYAGDKRIFLAEQFYDVTHERRRELHRRYIREYLSRVRGSNVIHSISDEFTGPLAFAQFWIDTVAEWQKDNGDVIVAISATKDVQDAILQDPVRSAVVDVIDIRYWYYQADGSLYAPPGGGNLAPRQWARVLKPKASSPEMARKAVAEYREKYPDKAVIYSVPGQESLWKLGE